MPESDQAMNRPFLSGIPPRQKGRAGCPQPAAPVAVGTPRPTTGWSVDGHIRRSGAPGTARPTGSFRGVRRLAPFLILAFTGLLQAGSVEVASPNGVVQFHLHTDAGTR